MFFFLQKFISPGELDPLNRRLITEPKPDVVVQGINSVVTLRMNIGMRQMIRKYVDPD